VQAQKLRRHESYQHFEAKLNQENRKGKMKKQLVLLVCMGALALGASAQNANSAAKTSPNARSPKPASAVKVSGADLAKKARASAVPGRTAPKAGPIARK